jgi:hypothetical protein
MLLGISIALGRRGRMTSWRHFLHAYLTAWSFVFSICIGSLFFILVHHLAKRQVGHRPASPGRVHHRRASR